MYKKTLRKFLTVVICYWVLVGIAAYVLAFRFQLTRDQFNKAKFVIFSISIVFTFIFVLAWNRSIKRAREDANENEN